MNLLQLIESTTLDAEQIAAHAAKIHAVVLGKSKFIEEANPPKQRLGRDEADRCGDL